VRKLSDWAKNLEDEFWKRGEAPELGFISLPALTKKLWGLRKKALTIVGARTSQGKSTFALQLAYDIASQGKFVWFLSLEMDVESLLERLFCHVERIDNFTVLSGQFSKDEKIRNSWRVFKDKIASLKMLITCDIGKTWGETSKMLEIVGEKKPDVVVVDYIQNISTRPGDTRESINEYLRQFRNLAIANDFAGILCSQINRGADNTKGPTLSQLKESGFLEESADVVLLLHWEGQTTEDKDIVDSKYTVIMAKNRNGRTGIHPLLYTPKFYRFEEIPANRGFVLPTPSVGDDGFIQQVVEMFGGEVVDPDRDLPRGG